MRSAILTFIMVWLPGLSAAQIPILSVSPARLVFTATGGGTAPLPQDIRIRNAGSGSLEWRAVSSAPWLRVSPPSGNAPSTLLVSLDPARLSPGPHSGRVTISAVGDADDSPAIVAVAVEITRPGQPAAQPPGPGSAAAQPRLMLTAPAGSAAATSTFNLDGPPGAPITWAAKPNQPWLSVEPPRGRTPVRVTVTARPGALPPGDHEATLLFVDEENEPWLIVPVTLTIAPPDAGTAAAADITAPAAAAAPAAPPRAPLSIAATMMPPATRNLPYSQAIPIRGGQPPYTVRIVQGRLPRGLTLANGAISGMTRFSGSYVFSIAVSDSSTPPQVAAKDLSLQVIALLQNTALMVGPPSISITTMAGQRSQSSRLTVESGAQRLNWQASTDASWLKLAPADGITPAMVQLDVNPEGLAPGVYTGTVTVTMEGAPNSPARIPIQLVVRK